MHLDIAQARFRDIDPLIITAFPLCLISDDICLRLPVFIQWRIPTCDQCGDTLPLPD